MENKDLLCGIKNVVFDLGNVLLDLDFDRTFQQLEHYLGEGYRDRLPKDLFLDYETGKITEAAFFDALRSAAKGPVSVLQLKDAWNSMLLTLPLARLELLERLKKNYRVYLLSNTNASHVDWMRGFVDYQYQIRDLEGRFAHKAYYSHEINLRKPNIDIYEYVLKDAGLKPEETLFIDDNPANVEAAQRAGIRAHLHPAGAEVMDLFKL